MLEKQQKSRLANQEQIIEELQDIIDSYINAHKSVHIFEAGCGNSSAFKFPSKVRITGVDISERQLLKNTHIHEKIQGNIQTFSTDKKYDIVICWNVLEHLENPESALFNLLTLTKLNGILILSAPNIYSFKGVVTKFTPFLFHKWVYKHIYKSQRIPFPTFLKLSMSPHFLHHYFRNHKFDYEAYLKMRLKGTLNVFHTFIVNVIKIISLGQWSANLAQYYFVVRKR